MSLANHLNRLSERDARAALTKCCAAERWVEAMLQGRPYASDASVFSAARDTWWRLTENDWQEAFAAHPQIGDLESLRAKYADTAQWAGGEQSGVVGSSEATLNRLAQLNSEYLRRFGYIFIVCATGKTAEQMLTLLEERLANEHPAELQIAAAEQLQITLLRLGKLAT